MVSLVAEPLAGLADTAFVARLGSTPLAAVGVAATLLSSVVWVFNFLGIGAQTEVATALGAGDAARARQATSLALLLALLLGLVLAIGAWPLLGPSIRWMGAGPDMESAALTYLRIRLLGAPAGLLLLVAFGALRGLQDMRTPLWVALAMNGLNVALDPVLIFGLGPVPALGVAGAAWATAASQWIGALLALVAAARRLGLTAELRWRDARGLFIVGRDLTLRTAVLLLFMLLATRTATRIGADGGAAHQALRQVWLLTALVLDAFAATAQSLVGYYVGALSLPLARRVAAVSCQWGVGGGVVLALAMLASEDLIAALLVPEAAHAIFFPAWRITAAVQPLNGLSFVTDGIHWGTADYRYLRNAMLAATSLGALLLAGIDTSADAALTFVWIATGVWIAVRALLGAVRVWPAIGRSPFKAV
jgi:MATE family multidrug resistance protein